MLRCLVVAVLVACGSPAKPPRPPPAKPPACLADELGPLRTPPQMETACLKTSCKDACAAGNADGCMMHAYALQRAEADAAAEQMYARACKLGLAIGCTNYAAGLWMASQNTEACIKRIFERACEASEPFGCGMIGRMLAVKATTEPQRIDARLHFEWACRKHAAMTCRMYAHHIENGDLGTPDPARVKELMERACDTGDDDACGHDTASETFR